RVYPLFFKCTGARRPPHSSPTRRSSDLERFDLVVCADVLHYLQDDEIVRGLPSLVRLIRGAAFLEVLTREDDVVGDTVGLIRRPDRKSTRLNSSHDQISYAVFCLKKKKT